MTSDGSMTVGTLAVAQTVASTSPTLKEHESLWFEDGNVVITTDSDIAFRLHRTILSIHSEIFRDMFSLPHHEENDAVTDGCPTIHFPDCAEHLAWLFTSFYYGHKDDFYAHDRLVGFPRVRAMMMLGHKYGVSHVYTEALRRLCTICPTTLAEFDTLVMVARRSRLVAHKPEDRIAIINMARSFDLPELLPYAFYICCTNVAANALTSGVSYGRDCERLSEPDLQLCLQGMKDLTLMVKDMITTLMNFTHSLTGCSSPHQCKATIPKFLETVNSRSYLAPNGLLLPLNYLVTLDQLCQGCRVHVQAEHDSFRSTVWNSLRRMFSVALS